MAWSDTEVSTKLGFADFMTTAQGGGKVVCLTHRLLFKSWKYSWYSFLLEVESTPGPECDRKDFMSMKITMTPSEIEPVTFRFVTQHLNNRATAVPIGVHYVLTPWCRVLLEKLTGLQLVKKFPAFHGTRRFITALTSVRISHVSVC